MKKQKRETCKRFYTYDNPVGAPRYCIMCGKKEEEHYDRAADTSETN